MTDPAVQTEDLTDEQVVTILNRYHELARANGTLELVAVETTGDGLFEVLYEVLDVAADLGYTNVAGRAWEKLRDALRNYGTRLKAELETSRLVAGAPVRVLGSRLGVMVNADSVAFVGSVAGGTVGTFRGMHPSEHLSGWALVDVDAAVVELGEGITLDDLGKPDTLVVPVHASAVERVQ